MVGQQFLRGLRWASAWLLLLAGLLTPAAALPQDRRVGNRQIGILSAGQARVRAEQFQGWLSAVGVPGARLLTAKQLAGGGLSGLDLLIVPRSPDLSVALWKLLPPFQAGGGSLIFEGIPLRTGQWGSEKFVPGMGPDLHLFYERGELPGLPKRGGHATLEADPELLPDATFPRRVVATDGGGARSVQRWVYRYRGDKNDRIEYRDDLALAPFSFRDEDGKLLAQQAVLVRHHCRLFPGATTIFVDITKPREPGYALLNAQDGPEVLVALVRLAFAPLPGERPARDYATHLALRKALSEGRDSFVESEYLGRDIAFLAAQGQGLPGSQGLARRSARVHASFLDLIDRYNHWRTKTSDAAWHHYTSMLAEIQRLQPELAALLVAQRQAFAAARARAPQQGVPLSQAKLVYGFASTPVRWGYADRYTLQAMLDAGMESYTDWRFDHDTARRLGIKISLYEFLHPLSKALRRAFAPPAGRLVLDLPEGRMRREHGTVTPVFGKVFETQRYQDFLEEKARRYADEPRINARVLAPETILPDSEGYDAGSAARYRKFLQDRHGDIAALDRRWGASFRSFGDVPLPLRPPRTQQEHADWFDFVDFRAHAVAAYLRRMRDTYHRLDPHHRVVTVLNQYSPLSGVDFYAVNQVMDRASSHNTPSSMPWYLPGLAARPGQRGENNEIKAAIPPYPWAGFGERGTQWRVRFHTLYTYASGVVEQEEHLWGATIGIRSKNGSGALGDRDGFFRLGGAEAKHFHQWKHSWEGFSDATPPHEWAEIGLYWSFATKSHGDGSQRVTKKGPDLFRSAFAIMNDWNRLLDAAHLPFDTVARQEVKAGALAKLKLIIVPQDLYMERAVAEGLLSWVQHGGELVVVGESGRFDEYGVRADLLLPSGIHMRETGEDVVVYAGKRVRLTPLHPPQNDGVALVSYPGAAPRDVLLRYQSGAPAAVRVPRGRGAITLLGFSLSADPRILRGTLSHGSFPLGMLRDAVARAGVQRPLDAADPQVRLATWRGDGGWFYTVVQNYSAVPRRAELVMAPGVDQIVDVALRVPLRVRIRGGRSQVTVPLIEAGGRVLAWHLLRN